QSTYAGPGKPGLVVLGVEKRSVNADRADYRQQAGGQCRGEAAGLRLKESRGLPDQPTGTQQGIPDHETDPGQDAERSNPIPIAARIGATADLDPLQQCPQRHALRECRDDGANAKPRVPSAGG